MTTNTTLTYIDIINDDIFFSISLYLDFKNIIMLIRNFNKSKNLLYFIVNNLQQYIYLEDIYKYVDLYKYIKKIKIKELVDWNIFLGIKKKFKNVNSISIKNINFNENIDSLSNLKLEKIDIVSEIFNQSIKYDNFPYLKKLNIISCDFNSNVDNLPKSLIDLSIFSNKFNKDINNLPETLKSLYVNSIKYNRDIYNLPKNLIVLDLWLFNKIRILLNDNLKFCKIDNLNSVEFINNKIPSNILYFACVTKTQFIQISNTKKIDNNIFKSYLNILSE
jgi:hypothetical protein